MGEGFGGFGGFGGGGEGGGEKEKQEEKEEREKEERMATTVEKVGSVVVCAYWLFGCMLYFLVCRLWRKR